MITVSNTPIYQSQPNKTFLKLLKSETKQGQSYDDLNLLIYIAMYIILLKPISNMSYTSEKFCLKWNDYEQNIISNYHDLRKESDFYDVTLVSEDDQQI